MSPVAAGGVVALTPETAPPGVSIQYVRGWNACLTAAQAEADRLRVDAERLIAKWRDESKVFASIGNQFDAGESWALAKCADDLDTAIHAAKTEQERGDG